jgi:hypothetical protein
MSFFSMYFEVKTIFRRASSVFSIARAGRFTSPFKTASFMARTSHNLRHST